MRRHRFSGWIAGIGSESGVRIVVGNWSSSPFGAFADVMIADGDGGRTLFAPNPLVARFVADTYHFDSVQVAAVRVHQDHPAITVEAGPLALALLTGGRTAAGWLLRCVPRVVATSPSWASAIDPAVSALLHGVRTAGTAGRGRREWYGATDVHAIVAARGTLGDRALGGLAAVSPPVRFGFGSAPRRPSLVQVVTTVEGELPS